MVITNNKEKIIFVRYGGVLSRWRKYTQCRFICQTISFATLIIIQSPDQDIKPAKILGHTTASPIEHSLKHINLCVDCSLWMPFICCSALFCFSYRFCKSLWTLLRDWGYSSYYTFRTWLKLIFNHVWLFGIRPTQKAKKLSGNQWLLKTHRWNRFARYYVWDGKWKFIKNASLHLTILLF